MCDESFRMFCVYLFSRALFKERKLFCFIRNSLTKWNEMKWNNKKALLIAKRSGKEQLLFVDKNNAALYSTMDKILRKSEFLEILFAYDELFLNNFSKKAKTWSTTTIHLSYLHLNLLTGMIVPLLLVAFFGCHEWSAYK